MKSRFQVARRWLIFWCMFIGVGAVGGSVGMFVSPDGSALGMDLMLPYFQVLPFADILFQNFIFSGISLLIVNGISNLTAAFLMIRKKKTGVVLGTIFGVTLMLWICIQFYIFPMNFMSTIYFVFGLIQALTGATALIFYKQETFANVEKNNISKMNKSEKQSDTLIVYFSRMGYTRHYAYELKKKYSADIYEVKACERTEGTLGFWWCGRFGMHGWSMPIEPVSVKLEMYDKIVICSPVWVFQLCGPIRSFCKEASHRIKSVDYVLVHYQKSKYKNVVEEMNALLGIKCTHAVSICQRQGREVKRYEFNN